MEIGNYLAYDQSNHKYRKQTKGTDKNISSFFIRLKGLGGPLKNLHLYYFDNKLQTVSVLLSITLFFHYGFPSRVIHSLKTFTARLTADVVQGAVGYEFGKVAFLPGRLLVQDLE